MEDIEFQKEVESKEQIIKRLLWIKSCVEFERFTMENIDAFIKDLSK